MAASVIVTCNKALEPDTDVDNATPEIPPPISIIPYSVESTEVPSVWTRTFELLILDPCLIEIVYSNVVNPESATVSKVVAVFKEIVEEFPPFISPVEVIDNNDVPLEFCHSCKLAVCKELPLIIAPIWEAAADTTINLVLLTYVVLTYIPLVAV